MPDWKITTFGDLEVGDEFKPLEETPGVYRIYLKMPEIELGGGALFNAEVIDGGGTFVRFEDRESVETYKA
jgi:hypothetical protein